MGTQSIESRLQNLPGHQLDALLERAVRLSRGTSDRQAALREGYAHLACKVLVEQALRSAEFDAVNSATD